MNLRPAKGQIAVDSDLIESIEALKTALADVKAPAVFDKANPALVNEVSQKLRLPRRFKEFLLEANPAEVESVTPIERVFLTGIEQLLEDQEGHTLEEDGSIITERRANGWRPDWIVIARSGILGDPYFLDVSQIDAEGDCPVYTAMSGTDNWKPRLCASSFALFLRILAITMDVAQDFEFDDSEYDADNERVFREAVAPRIREWDPAAVKARHWT